MKIIDFLDFKSYTWCGESYDVWIAPNGQIYDLGESCTHLTFIKESIGKTIEIKDLLERGWVKITNTNNQVSIECNENSLKMFRNSIFDPILEKAKNVNFSLEIKIYSKNQNNKINLEMPRELYKLNLI